MRFKKVFAVLLACAVMMGSFGAYAGAVGADVASGEGGVQRASGKINMDIPAHSWVESSRTFSLEAGESITINATYSPRSASVDFGVIAPDGLFYSVNVTDGSVDQEIEVDERGSYTLAVRNNSSQTVSVSGYVYY